MTDYLFQLPPKTDGKRHGTLQAQIQEMMVSAILNKQLPAGCVLPSGRKLAEQLKVSRNTVVQAYLSLMDEGFIESRERSGFYVCKDVLEGYVEPNKRGADALENTSVDWNTRLCQKPHYLPYYYRPNDWQSYPYPFIYGQYTQKLFPVADWRECCREAANLSAIHDWARDSVDQDNAGLIQQVREKLLPRRGIFVDEDEILITVGAQNAIYMVAELLLDHTKTIGMENPGYPDARNTFLTNTQKMVLLEIDEAGMVVDERLQGCDCVYTTPSHQFPSTVTMPKTRRLALLESAHEHDFIIIEDDYESELNYVGEATPALKSLDADGRVIHLGSLSKTIAPGIRLGYVVGPKAFIKQMRALRRLMLRHTPANNQYIVSVFLKRGYHDSLVRRISHTLDNRSHVMRKMLDEYFPNASPKLVFGGSSYWVRGPKGMDSEALAEKAKAQGVLIDPGGAFFHNDMDGREYFRLGFSSISIEQIEQGIPLLAKLVQESVD
ncbi:MAG: PLP-dependent aminotransferase family protein [Arenicellales bacterium]